MTERERKWEHGIERHIEIMHQDSTVAVLHERCDQILKHGYDAEHDRNRNDDTELARAASAVLRSYEGHDELGRQFWPLEHDFDHITEKTPYDKLAVAAALILAEMDRLDRIEK